MPKRTDIKSVMILGAGPIVIGQACEFDNDSGSVLIHTDEVDKYAAERGIEVS